MKSNKVNVNNDSKDQMILFEDNTSLDVIKEFVFEKDNKVFTDSLTVARVFNKLHSNVLRDIKNLLSMVENSCQISPINFELATYIDEQGKERPMYIMNRDGFSLLVMGFTGKLALKYKLKYIEAFNRMEEYIRTQLDKKEWLQVRIDGKIVRKDLNAVVNDFIEYAKDQGASDGADFYYSNITACENTNLFGIPSLSKIEKVNKEYKEKVKNKSVRDFCSITQLSFLTTCEHAIRNILLKGMNRKKHYKEIYKDIKEYAEELSEYIGVSKPVYLPQYLYIEALPKKILKELEKVKQLEEKREKS